MQLLPLLNLVSLSKGTVEAGSWAPSLTAHHFPVGLFAWGLLESGGWLAKFGVCWCQWTQAKASSSRYWCRAFFSALMHTLIENIVKKNVLVVVQNFYQHFTTIITAGCSRMHLEQVCSKPSSPGMCGWHLLSSHGEQMTGWHRFSQSSQAQALMQHQWRKWSGAGGACLLYVVFVFEFPDISVLLILHMSILNVPFLCL